MKILALETSTAAGGAAVVVDGQIIAEEVTRRQRSHSEQLHPFIDKVLAAARLELKDIDAYAVGRGPGSFTGIRVAANAAMALAKTFDRPLIAIDTLTLIAARQPSGARPVLSIINAFKNLLYYGLYDVHGPTPSPLKDPAVISIHDLASVLPAGEKVIVAGDGWTVAEPFLDSTVRARFIRPPDVVDEPSPGILGQSAARRLQEGNVTTWSQFSPLYLRASEAEEKHALFKPGK